MSEECPDRLDCLNYEADKDDEEETDCIYYDFAVGDCTQVIGFEAEFDEDE